MCLMKYIKLRVKSLMRIINFFRAKSFVKMQKMSDIFRMIIYILRG